jgi:hypothetical protein
MKNLTFLLQLIDCEVHLVVLWRGLTRIRHYRASFIGLGLCSWIQYA